jgi:hypothetical protein
MNTTVHSLRCERITAGDVRIDRQTRWGNRYVIGRDGTREEVIAKCEAAFRRQLAAEAEVGLTRLRDDLRGLRGKRLFCWCAPLACHGHVLARLAEEVA